MKKILYILLILSLSNCTTLKKITSTKSKIVDEKEVIKDSTSITDTSKAIKDEIITNVGTTGNRECDEKLIALLEKMNTSKSSGDNSYRLYYDAQLNALRAEFEVGATTSTNTNTNESNIERYSAIEEVEEYIKKVKVPWWAYALLVYIFRNNIIGILSIFFPGIRGIKTLGDLLTPPNKK